MRPPAPPPDAQPPAAGRRSSKRDLIVDVFLTQADAVGADDLVALVRRDDQRISRATVYRTLQWMIDAGIARKVDAGEGRVRFAHTYRHPRHFLLMCKQCSGAFEFLSADIEELVDEVALARGFEAHQCVLQVYGTCERCRAGQASTGEVEDRGPVLARDALRVAIATVRSALEFYTRAARLSDASRDLNLFLRFADDERAHLAVLEAHYKALLEGEPQLESRPTFLFFKDAANGIFAKGVEAIAGLDAVADVVELACRGERGAHRFFTRCAARIEEPERRQLFVALADTGRAHLAKLVPAGGPPAGRRGTRGRRRQERPRT